ncbi:hypothetical protein [Vibrio splendidus]|uniref:hypothetical protein n=1 Tax=Vibrio splendidus TaxID=29497 RepID=UPI000E329D71|nr:hypothetical protein [Vibrio splendidus]
MNLSNFATWVVETDVLSPIEKNEALDGKYISKYITVKVAMTIVASLSLKRERITEVCKNYFLIDNDNIKFALEVQHHRLLKTEISQERFDELMSFVKIKNSNRRLVGSIIPILSKKKYLRELIDNNLVHNDRLMFNFLRRCIEVGDNELYEEHSHHFSDNSVERHKLDLIKGHYNNNLTTDFIESEFLKIDEPYFSSYLEINKPWDIVEPENYYFDLKSDSIKKISLNEKIEYALKNKEPFNFLRIGDGESYGFSESIALSERQEKHWWGQVLPICLRDQLKSDFNTIFEGNIDLLAIPSAHKYAYYLNYKSLGFEPQKSLDSSVLSRNALVDNSVFSMLQAGLLMTTMFCDDQINKHFVNKERLLEYIELAARLVIVSGKKKSLILESLGDLNIEIEIIEIPTHNLTKFMEDSNSFNQPLPFVYKDILSSIEKKVCVGDLCLISAGFIGKIFSSACANRGAVSIDIGQAIEELVK